MDYTGLSITNQIQKAPLIMEEKDIEVGESFQLIHQMIHNARSRIVDNGFSWLIWGTLIILASLSTYFLLETGSSNIWMGWNIFGIIAVLMFIFSWIKPKKQKVKTYVDELLQWADFGFGVSLFVIIASINLSVHPNVGFGYFLMLYAFLMLIQGGAMQFKPLIWGAIINWIGALGIFYFQDLKYDMLITAAAVFLGYIIPGIILFRRWKKSQKTF